LVILKTAINQHGWDGNWYWRASKDNGEVIGSHKNEEGKIFLNAQTWSVISGTAENSRQESAMQAVEEYLEGGDVGPILFHPAYSKPDSHIGYLSRYAPGIRENGGVYTHAATWTIWAANIRKNTELSYRVYKKLCPIYNGMNPDRYVAEPYVTPGNISGPDSPHYGRGGWTWYTGSAGWLYRVTLDYLIGIRAEYDGLVVNPCLPKEWKKIKVNRLFRGVNYSIEIESNGGGGTEVNEILVDGKKIDGNVIPVFSDKEEVKVTIKI
jgi:cellobiose phosphorylase